MIGSANIRGNHPVRRSDNQTMRRGSRGASWAVPAAFVAFVIAGVVVPAAPAAAHAVLLETTPAADAVLDTAPEAITLRFNEPVSASLGGIVVFPAEGPEIRAEHIDVSGDGTTATAGLPELDAGAYAVSWRVVSSDAHPIRGAFTFSVGDAAGDDAAGQLAERLKGAGGGGSDAVGLIFGVARFGVFAGLSLLVGGFAFLWLVWPDGVRSPGVRRILLGAWATTLVATLAGIGLQGAYASDGSLADALDFGLIGDVLETRFGIVWLLRVGLLLPVASMILRLGTEDTPQPSGSARFTDAAVAGLLLLTPGLAGHASTGEMIPVALVSDVVHMGAIAVWLGGLVLLCAVVLPRRDPSTMSSVIPRFSNIALLAVIAIMASGTFQSWRQIRYKDAVTDTTFGRLVLVKIALFLGLIGVAAVSRRLVHGRLRLPSVRVPRLAGPGAMRVDPDDTMSTHRLRRCVLVEVAMSVVVLGVTAGLVNAVPAREATASSAGPFAATLERDGLVIEVEVTPAKAGANQMHVYTFGADGVTAEPIPELKATISQPERDLGPLPVTLQTVYPGHWVAPTLEIPLAGTWTLDFDARISEFDQIRLDTTFEVSP